MSGEGIGGTGGVYVVATLHGDGQCSGEGELQDEVVQVVGIVLVEFTCSCLHWVGG